MKISIKSIDNPLNTLLFTISVIVIGLMCFKFLPVELFPEVDPPIVFVSIQYPGASPTEIEFQINKKVEDELKNLEDVKKMTSVAVQGVGTIILQFESGVDSDDKRSKVKEGMDNIRSELPQEIETPIIRKLDFAKMPVMNVVLYKEGLDYVTLKDIAEKVKEEFERIPQISAVKIFGGLDREITVAVNPDALKANKVSLTEVINFFNKGNLDTPGGKLTIGTREYPIRVLARFKDASDVENSVLTYRNGKPIYIKNLGEVTTGKAEVESYARYNGIPAISLAVTKQDKSNLLKLSQQIYQRIDLIKKSKLLPEGLKIAVIGDQADEVRIRVNELTNNIVQGVFVVFVVLLLSMGFRNAVIASLGIPFAMVFTMIGLLVFGETINNISQFGLILVVGIVVDGAIVVLENTYRHIEMGKDPISGSKVGVEEVGSAVISSGLTTMGVFAPMIFMTGVTGQFMSVIPKTVIMALVGSLVFDHIVIPVMCSKFLKVKHHDQEKTHILIRILKKTGWGKNITYSHPFEAVFQRYQKFIRWSIAHRIIICLIAFLLFCGGVSLIGGMKKEFFPELDIGKLYIEIELPQSSKVEETDRITKQIEEFVKPDLKTADNLLAYIRNVCILNIIKPDVQKAYNPNGFLKQYVASVGSSGVQTMFAGTIGSQSTGPNIGRIDIDMVDIAERDIDVDSYMANLRRTILKNCPGAKFRIRKPQGGPPVGDPVNVVVYGDNIAVLKRISKNMQAIIKQIPGAIEVKDNYGLGRPEIQMRINRSNAKRYGFSVQEIQNYIFVLINGYEVAKYQYGQDEYEIRLKLTEKHKSKIEDLRKLTIQSSTLREPIPITELVDISVESGVSIIIREDSKRAVTVSGEVDRSRFTTSQVASEMVRLLKDYPLPPGYHLKFRGENEERDESFDGLIYAFLVGIMTIYFIIVIQLKSLIQPFAIMVTVMLSVIGIALGLFLSGSNVGIMAMFGAVSLAGIVVNDAIVLVSYINILRARGLTMRDAIIESCETRLRAIFLTTFTTAGGLLPLALALGGARKFWTPMGWSIIGGLMVATFQTLIVVPVVYSILEDLKTKFSHTATYVSRMLPTKHAMKKTIGSVFKGRNQ